MTQRLCKLDTRIEIISIPVSKVGIEGDTPTEVTFVSYCEPTLTQFAIVSNSGPFSYVVWWC